MKFYERYGTVLLDLDNRVFTISLKFGPYQYFSFICNMSPSSWYL